LVGIHASGVVHRNLKPKNIFLQDRAGDSDFVRILDFCVAKVVRSQAKLTLLGQVLGTPGYMSPEQSTGSPVDYRSDVCSLGIVLREMLTGSSACDEWELNILEKRPVVPPELEAVVERCLARNPEHRYQTAGELLSALRALKWDNEVFAPGYQYDIALSFAREDQARVDPIAKQLQGAGVRVFYDAFEQSQLWGIDLVERLYDVYSRRAKYCMIFVSRSYLKKKWTSHERRAAQERALTERQTAYILPVRLDESSLPGWPDTVGFVDIDRGTEFIVRLALEKLRKRGT
jgi:hypothetical protein